MRNLLMSILAFAIGSFIGVTLAIGLMSYSPQAKFFFAEIMKADLCSKSVK